MKLYSINGKVEATFRKECDDFREYTSQWKIKKDEAVIEENKISRYQQFIKKVSGKEEAKNLNSSAYEKYL